MVFQDPVDSLDPRMRIGHAIAEPLATLRPDIPAKDHAVRVVRAMREVELDPQLWTRRPRQLSGGQAQRAAIARALVAEPDLLVCDEATSALDVSVQAEVLDLLGRLQRRRGLALLFVSHDLAVVRRLCHRVVVLDRGTVVEEGSTEQVIAAPRSAAAKRLVAAALA
jgi:ABC-type microcin C transport system duplicated ATPase subunit YejF